MKLSSRDNEKKNLHLITEKFLTNPTRVAALPLLKFQFMDVLFIRFAIGQERIYAWVFAEKIDRSPVSDSMLFNLDLSSSIVFWVLIGCSSFVVKSWKKNESG